MSRKRLINGTTKKDHKWDFLRNYFLLWKNSAIKRPFYGTTLLSFCNRVEHNFCYFCCVKFVAIILSTYFLALNFVPCNDAGNTKDNSQLVSAIDYDSNHGQDCELCSPFCQCHCCQVHTIDSSLVTFEPLQPTIQQKRFVHFNTLGKDLSISFFQPPRA